MIEAGHRLIETAVKSLGGVVAAIDKGRRGDVARLATAAEFLSI